MSVNSYTREQGFTPWEGSIPSPDQPGSTLNSSRVFFLHNPKAGGSSLRLAFGSLYSSDVIAPIFNNAPNEHRASKITVENHGGFQLYFGHYGYDVFDTLANGHHLLTNFRDPIERIISLYRYWRNNVSVEDLAGTHPNDAAIVLLSQQEDFGTFIRSSNQDLLLYISNFHFRQLYWSPWEKLRPKPWHVAIVKQRISKMRWFYVSERPRISEFLLHKTFPDLSSVEVPMENVSKGSTINVTSSDIEHLIRLNRIDYALYRHALKEQDARLT